MPWFYWVGKLIARMLFLLLTHRRVRGRECVPGEGPVIIVANHMNLADIPLLVISLGRIAIFMAKKELFYSRIAGYFLRRLGSFAVHRGQLDRKALRQAMQVLANDSALVVFPEGMRSKNAQLRPAFSGPALIAVRSGAPLLPVGITGTEKIKGMAWILQRPEVTVNVGHPFYLPPVNGRLTRTELAERTNSIMQHIAELLPPEYQGSYAKGINRKT